MPLIEDNERKHFEQCVVEAGLRVDDFELTEQPDEFGSKQGYFPTGIVTVTYTRTGVARRYHTGGVSPWSAQFERDLKSKVFQKRSRRPR